MRSLIATSSIAPGLCPCDAFTLKTISVVVIVALAMSLAGCSSGGGGGTTSLPKNPNLTWATPAAITYGIALSGTQLNAKADVAGTFAYSPAAGTVPKAGTQTLSVVFTPTDTVGYTSADKSVQLTVNQATPTISVPPTANAITSGQALSASTLTGGTASVSNTSIPGSFAWTTPSTVPAVGTDSESVTFTPTDATDYTKATATVQIVVNPVSATVTSVTLACNPTSITDIQTTSCTPTVTGTGAFTNTVNLMLSPAAAGTLSVTSGVASGTKVTFIPAFTGASTPTITATSTADSTKSDAVQLTVTLRTIEINSTIVAAGNFWLDWCAGIVLYNTAQEGMVKGDTIHVDPYSSQVYTSTPPSTLPITLGIGNDPGKAGACSPGAYSEYVTGTDSARSNTNYIPIIPPRNMWAGYNATDEFQSDFAAQTTCPYKLTDGSADGKCLPVAELANVVDGDYLATSKLYNTGVGATVISTGAPAGGINRTGDMITDIAMKNKILCDTQATRGMLSCFNVTQFAPTVTDRSLGVAPASIAMSTGCNPDPNTATIFTYDEEATVIYRLDATNGGTVTIGNANSVSLAGFSPASQLTTTLARYVVAWDNTCKAAVLAPVLTGGTNPDGSAVYEMQFALADMTVGTMRQLGTYVSSTTVGGVTTSIPSTAIRMVADPSGNDVVIASTDEAAGTTTLTKISWTLDAKENPTFTVTALGSAPPVGVYGVSLGVLPSSVVPGGTTIRIGQRQQHYALANK